MTFDSIFWFFLCVFWGILRFLQLVKASKNTTDQWLAEDLPPQLRLSFPSRQRGINSPIVSPEDAQGAHEQRPPGSDLPIEPVS